MKQMMVDLSTSSLGLMFLVHFDLKACAMGFIVFILARKEGHIKLIMGSIIPIYESGKIRV